MTAEVEHVLAVRRVQVRDAQVGERGVRTRTAGSRTGGGSSPTRTSAPPLGCEPIRFPCRSSVGGSVEARSLAVPDADHPVAGGAGKGAGELAALTEVAAASLVQARDERDVVRVEQLLQPAELLVVAYQRGSLVPGDERPDASPGGQVAPVLVDGQPGQGPERRSAAPGRWRYQVAQLRAAVSVIWSSDYRRGSVLTIYLAR